MPHKSETPHDGGASRNSCGGTFRDPSTSDSQQLQFDQLQASTATVPAATAPATKQPPQLTLVANTGAHWTGIRDRQFPKGFRAVENADGWRVGMWVAQFCSFVPFNEIPMQSLAEAEQCINLLRVSEFRPVYPPMHRGAGPNKPFKGPHGGKGGQGHLTQTVRRDRATASPDGVLQAYAAEGPDVGGDND